MSLAVVTTEPLGLRAWHLRRRLAAGLLCAGALTAFIAVPAYAAFDSIYSLVWGQEIDRGVLPSFDAYRAPTEHPLWVAVCALLAPLGAAADRALVAVCIGALVALALGCFRLARVLGGELTGWIAAALVLSRLDYGFLAVRAYVDVPFLALVVWAGALEAERPRRGWPVAALLAAAGLLRPEAWLLAGAYALWLRRHFIYAALAPAVWLGVDAVVTGDPLYSLHYTTRSALALGRRLPVERLPDRLVVFLAELTKLPVLLAGLTGIVLAWQLRRPLRLPLIGTVFGIATFLAVSARGFAVVDRYLALSALGLTLFAAFALGGWTNLPPSRRRTSWAAGALAVAVLGSAWTAVRFNPGHIGWELRTRQVVHADLVRLLSDPRMRACGPISVPDHKLIPDVRFLLHAPRHAVVARSALPHGGRSARGPALFVTGRRIVATAAYGPFAQRQDSPLVEVPGPAERRLEVGRYLTAYAGCAAGTARASRRNRA